MDTVPDTMSIVQEMLKERGIKCSRVVITDLQRGKIDVLEYIAKETPDVILYDIAPPYQENWNYFKFLRKAFPEIDFIVTTSSVKSLSANKPGI